jgi:hypothetical protein
MHFGLIFSSENFAENEGFLVSDPLCLYSSSALFFDYSFRSHHPVNWDDWHLLAHAMASDFTVTLQFSQREHFFHYGSNSTPRENEVSKDFVR